MGNSWRMKKDFEIVGEATRPIIFSNARVGGVERTAHSTKADHKEILMNSTRCILMYSMFYNRIPIFSLGLLGCTKV